MTTFPGSPRLIKGALIALDPADWKAVNMIAFQYNPETLTRSLEPQTVGESGAAFESQRLKGAPVETIRLEAELDATDQLEQGAESAVEEGIYPQLATLEMMIYPKVTVVTFNTVALSTGAIEVVPPSGPLIFFVWNYPRILPVRIAELSITEESFDAKLNPIRAKISLSLRVLSYNDFSWTHPGFTFFMAHQTIKEVMSAQSTLPTLTKDVRFGKIKLF